jgi:hypothetical protein
MRGCAANPSCLAQSDRAELIALPVSWQIVIVKTKSTGFTPKTSEFRKMVDAGASAMRAVVEW